MPRPSPLPFLMATLFLDAVGVGLIFPVTPDLIAGLEGGTIGDAALWGGVLATAFALMQLLCAPVLGALSDRFGRRPVLLASLAVMALDYAASALAGSIWVLLLMRLVAGATAATHSTVNAAVADLVPPEERSRTFGLMGAAFTAGFVLGPVLGGLLGELGARAPFWAAAGLAAANLAFGWRVLPETVTERTRRPFDPGRAVPWGALSHVGRLKGVRPLLWLVFLQDLAFVAYPATWAFWGKAAFGWTPTTIGLSLAAFGGVAAVTQAWLMPIYLRRLGEGGTILWGTAWSALSLLLFALLPPTTLGGLLAILLCPLSALGEVTIPAIQGRISRRTPPDAQGEALGVVASARSAALVLGPLVMTAAFAWGSEGEGWRLIGAAYLLAAILMGASLVLFLRTREIEPRPESKPSRAT